MNHKFRLGPALLILVCGICPAISQNLPQPQELIQAANSASDLSGIRPYTLRATLVVKPGSKEKNRGRLTIYQDKERSRAELEFGSYRELRVVLGSREYVARNALSRPIELTGMADILHLWRDVLAPTDELGPSFVQEIDGAQATCVAVTEPPVASGNAKFARPREVVRHCFDLSKKVLLELASSRKDEGKVIRETHYLNYQAVSGLQFPGTIRHFSLGKPAGVDFEDIQLSNLNPDSVDFAPPQNALEFETCDDPKPARSVKVIDPSYPEMAKLAHVQGDVHLWAIIGKDGTLQNIKAVMGHPILIQAAVDAVMQWQYSPAMCGTRPVAEETELSLRFSIASR
jgi:hypothetical protein